MSKVSRAQAWADKAAGVFEAESTRIPEELRPSSAHTSGSDYCVCGHAACVHGDDFGRCRDCRCQEFIHRYAKVR